MAEKPTDTQQAPTGPVLLSGAAGEYTAVLDTPVPLEGLVEGDDTFAFVLSEAIDAGDRNADADPVPNDFVVTLRDKDTGLAQPIGQPYEKAPSKGITTMPKGSRLMWGRGFSET